VIMSDVEALELCLALFDLRAMARNTSIKPARRPQGPHEDQLLARLQARDTQPNPKGRAIMARMEASRPREGAVLPSPGCSRGSLAWRRVLWPLVPRLRRPGDLGGVIFRHDGIIDNAHGQPHHRAGPAAVRRVRQRAIPWLKTMINVDPSRAVRG